MSDELVQRVADVISMVYESEGIIDVSKGVIALIHNETLEEAAKVVEDPTVTRNAAGHAAAIRALKDNT